jgi:putative ABC transport system permease protein
VISVVPWRILTHERVRSALAIAGIFVALLLIFLQLGFYFSVPEGGMLLLDHLKFDVLLTSKKYVFQAQSQIFPRHRVFEAKEVPGVASVSALYQNSTVWRSSVDGTRTNVFVFGADLADDVFTFPEFRADRAQLSERDTVLVDVHSKPSFGRLYAGRRVEVNDRKVTIVGTYDVGIGFVGLGIIVTSDVNFTRLFPGLTRDNVSLGLVRLVPGADPARVVARLRQIMPPDTEILTRDEIAARESAHWVRSTSVGLVFGFGVIIAFIVGLIILYQTLAAQIVRNLPEFAMMKSIGYTAGDLSAVVVRLAVVMTGIAFVPAVLVAVVVYKITAVATLLPIYMTFGRLMSVMALALAMSFGSALFSARALRRADPVELF